MPIFTRRSRTSTSQIVSARLSKNGPMDTFASDTSLPRPRDTVGSEVWRQCVLVLAQDLGFRGGNCNGLLANTGFFLSTGNRYLFLLQRRSIPFDSFSLLPIQVSRAWRQSFVIEVSDLYSSSPWFQLLIIGHRHLLMNLHVVQF